MDVDYWRLYPMWERREEPIDLGESYFNELINRSMIQPIHEYADMIYGCRVHDMVLDLICSLSTEENFVTALNGMEHISSSNIIRRLSLQNGKEDDAATVATRSLQQVRSVVVFPLPLVYCQPLGASEFYVYWIYKVVIFHKVTALSMLRSYFTWGTWD